MSSVLVVGSVALDSVETPFGRAEEVLGGSATFFSASASLLAPVQLVGVVGQDYPLERLEPLKKRGVDFAGLECADGESFHWRGRYRHDLNAAETIETRLGVFSHFRPKIPDEFRDAPFVFLGNIDPRLQLDVLQQVSAAHRAGESGQGRTVDHGARTEARDNQEGRARSVHVHAVERVLRSRLSARGGLRPDWRGRLVRGRVHRLPRTDGRSERAQSQARRGVRLRHGIVRGGALLDRSLPGDRVGRVREFHRLVTFEEDLLR